METEIKIVYVNITELIPAEYNPRQWTEDHMKDLEKSLTEHGFIDPLIVNSAPERKNIIIGGHFRLMAAKMLGLTMAPVVYVNIPDLETEQKLNIRLNKVSGAFDWNKLANFNQDILLDSGFTKLELAKGFDLILDEDGNMPINLPNGEKPPFEQMTFTFTDEQAAIVKDCLNTITQTEEAKVMEGNKNANGIYLILKQWQQQKTS